MIAAKTVPVLPICKLCNKKFTTFQMLEKHSKKKYPCKVILACEKCKKEFTRASGLKKHSERKTSCEPIQGDPTKKAGDTSCMYCYKDFKNKYSLRAHFNTCKIKNGGMNLLFAKIKNLENENKENKQKIKKLETQNTKNAQVINNNKTYNTHHGHNLNLQIINYGSPEQAAAIAAIVSAEVPRLLDAPHEKDTPFHEQIQKRLQAIVSTIYRNPMHPQLQCVYVADPTEAKDNAYTYEDGWVIQDWKKLGPEILQSVYNYVKNARIQSDADKLNVTRHIFNLAGFGELDETWTEKRVVTLFEKLGEQLGWDSLMIEKRKLKELEEAQ